MATIKYLLQSKKDNSNIYVRYSINRTLVWKRKTGFVINAKDWSYDKAQPIQKNEELKAIKFKLDKLSIFINNAYNHTISKGIEFTIDWLQHQIDKNHLLPAHLLFAPKNQSPLYACFRIRTRFLNLQAQNQFLPVQRSHLFHL